MANAPKKVSIEAALKTRCVRYLPSGSDNESDLGLSLDVEVTGLLGGALGINESFVGICVLLGVGCSVGSGGLTGDDAGLLVGGAFISEELHELSVSLGLLEDVLGDSLCPKT